MVGGTSSVLKPAFSTAKAWIYTWFYLLPDVVPILLLMVNNCTAAAIKALKDGIFLSEWQRGQSGRQLGRTIDMYHSLGETSVGAKPASQPSPELVCVRLNLPLLGGLE